MVQRSSRPPTNCGCGMALRRMNPGVRRRARAAFGPTARYRATISSGRRCCALLDLQAGQRVDEHPAAPRGGLHLAGLLPDRGRHLGHAEQMRRHRPDVPRRARCRLTSSRQRRVTRAVAEAPVFSRGQPHCGLHVQVVMSAAAWPSVWCVLIGFSSVVDRVGRPRRRTCRRPWAAGESTGHRPDRWRTGRRSTRPRSRRTGRDRRRSRTPMPRQPLTRIGPCTRTDGA